jgi:hypothetical protein
MTRTYAGVEDLRAQEPIATAPWQAPHPDGPPLDFVPGGARVLAVLGRLDRAMADAERVWDGLDPSLREGLQPPGELLEEAGCA